MMDAFNPRAITPQWPFILGFCVARFIRQSGIPLAVVSSLLIVLFHHILPTFFKAQFIILSFYLHSLVLLKHPWAPDVRYFAKCISLIALRDRPRTLEEQVFYIFRGVPLYCYITTALFCNSWKAGLWAIGLFVILACCAFPRVVFSPVLGLLVVTFPNSLGPYLRAPTSFQQTSPEFIYTDLPSTYHIRLLKIKRKILFRPVQCELVLVDIDSAPPYDAISYTWGAPDLMRRISMTNGTLLPVTAKVHAIIHERASFLRQRLVWIDAVCIWQTNHVEKASQLNLMREIYQKASRTIVWLGERPDGRDIHKALSTIRQTIKLGEAGWYANILGPWLAHLMFQYENEKVALLEMLMNPYWLRVWIIQEVVLQKTVHVLYGDTWFFWEDIAEALRGFGSIHPISAVRFENIRARMERQNGGQLAQIAVVAKLKKWADEGMEISAARVVHLCSWSKATVDKDKIYGVLGLVRQHLVNADYSDSTTSAQVFLDTTRRMLEIPGVDQMFVLQKAGIGYDRKTKGIPSWVPDWAHPPQPFPLARGFTGDLARDQYRAARGLKLFQNPKTGSDMIKVRALLVDTVTKVVDTVLSTDMNSLKPPGAAAVVRWIAGARELVLSNPAVTNRYRPGADELNNCFWRTLVGDRWQNLRPIPTSILRNCDAWCERIVLTSHLTDEFRAYDFGTTIPADPREPITANPRMRHFRPAQGELDERMMTGAKSFSFENSMREASFGRRFGVTASGRMVLLPPGGAAGDRVCVIAGAETPFALRRDEGDEAWQLVGETYAHGIMDGESVALGDAPEKLLVR